MWGFPLWEHVRTKVTSTIELGTSPGALQCGFCAVHDLLCTTFYSKNHTTIEVLNKQRWKTKDVLEGRIKTSKDSALLFCTDANRASRAAMNENLYRGSEERQNASSGTVYQKCVPN